MSREKYTRNHRNTTLAVGVAGAAFAAALIGMGAAGVANADPFVPFVDPYAPPDPYDVLFGAMGQQGIDNNLLDGTIAVNPNYDMFASSVNSFEAANDHGLANLIFAIDPSAFYEQVGGGAVGTLADSAYLVPTDGLGYLATGLDYGLLSPTGLAFVLDPVLSALAGMG